MQFVVCVGRVWVVIVFLFLEKQTFNGLLKIKGYWYTKVFYSFKNCKETLKMKYLQVRASILYVSCDVED